MSAEKRKGSVESSTREPVTCFRAVTYVRMQLLDLEFLAVQKLMTNRDDPKKLEETFEKVKEIFGDATTAVTNVPARGILGCKDSNDCGLDEHCDNGRCVFGPER
jgi:hypothetical protein